MRDLCLVTQWCPTLVTPWTISRQAPLSMGTLQVRILEWVAMPSSRGSSQPRDQTKVSHIAGGFFTIWATREAGKMQILRPHFKQSESETLELGPSNLFLTRPPSDSVKVWDPQPWGRIVFILFPISSTSFSTIAPLPKGPPSWLLHGPSCTSPFYSSHSKVSDHFIPC